ncbi:MAG TPA: hypothetical protein VF518_17120, partial [Polyangia bacterium]
SLRAVSQQHAGGGSERILDRVWQEAWASHPRAPAGSSRTATQAAFTRPGASGSACAYPAPKGCPTCGRFREAAISAEERERYP